MGLKWLNSIVSPSGRIARCALELQQFDFEVEYQKRKVKCGGRCALTTTFAAQRYFANGKQHGDIKCGTPRLVEKITKEPGKYKNCLWYGENLYRHITYRAGHEHVGAWKLCDPKQRGLQVLKESTVVPSEAKNKKNHQNIFT